MDMEHGPEKEPQYSFLQKNIKDEKINSTKLAWKGFIFGLTASITFFAVKPIVEPIFQKKPGEIEIPVDEEVLETDFVDSVVTEQDFTIDSYRKLNRVLGDVTKEAQKSIVYLFGVLEEDSWSKTTQQTEHQTSGLIVADNGTELLILANYQSMKDASFLRAKLMDGTIHETVLKQKDTNKDLAIFSIAKQGIKEETWNHIQVSTLGNSNTLIQGRTLIAVGSPFGYENSLGYGIVSSGAHIINDVDGQYRTILTDIPGEISSNGFLFDTQGNAVGMIRPSKSVLQAIGISDLKKEMELMSNGNPVPYIGVIGEMITTELSEWQGIPKGLYVKEVEMDSPAMKAGIQSGDILTTIHKETIHSLKSYRTLLLGQEVGKDLEITAKRRGAEDYVDIKFNVTVGVKQ